MESVRQLRASRVDPRGEPVRTDISGGTGKLADQNNRGLVVKAIVVFVSIGFFSMAGVAIGQKDHFQRTVRGEARFKSKIRRVADEGGISGPHGKERGITVNKGGAEAVIDSQLATQMAVKIVSGVKGIVSLRDVVSEDGGVQLCFVPAPGLKSFGQLLAVDANLPGQQSVGSDFGFAKLGNRRFVTSGQRVEREAAIFVQIEKVVMALSRRLGHGVQRVSDVLQQKCAVCFEKIANIRRQGFDCFIKDQLVSIAAPGARVLREEDTYRNDGKQDGCALLGFFGDHGPHSYKTLGPGGCPQGTALAAIEKVNHKSDGQP